MYRRTKTRPMRQIEETEVTRELATLKERVSMLVDANSDLRASNVIFSLQVERLLHDKIALGEELARERNMNRFLTGQTLEFERSSEKARQFGTGRMLA